jgi:alanine-synthesizing transaminase
LHYLCDEEDGWQPDLADIRSKITPNTRGIVVINPNNPTGAVYTPQMQQALIEIAREHDLVVFADEIYDKILFDDQEYIPLASYADDLLIMTFRSQHTGLHATVLQCSYPTCDSNSPWRPSEYF